MMSRSKSFLSVGVIALVLAWLWPNGLPAHFASTGIAPDRIALYEAASPGVKLPIAAMIYVAIFLLSGLTNRVLCRECAPTCRGVLVSFGVYWVALGCIAEALGAPFVTGDSTVYLRHAVAPWESFGGHHPSGTMWVLWLGSHLGLPVAATVTALGALEASILQRILSVRGARFLAGVAGLSTLFYPDLLILRTSLWSEPVMFLGIVVAALAFTRAYVPPWTLVGGMLVLFLALCEVRHAAIFLLPGFVLGLSVYLSGGRFWRSCLFAGGIGGAFLGAWLGLNFLRTGIVTAPSRGSFECVHFIAAYHRMPFCSTSPTIPLCVADPEGAFLRQQSGSVPTFVELDQFQFSPQSPLKRLNLSPEAVCDVWALIRRDLIANHKWRMVRMFITRVISQFGEWEVSERAALLIPPMFPGSVETLDVVADKVNKNGWALWALWGTAAIVGFRAKRLYAPAVLFLVMGACGHAFGIALNNPFLAMRYLAVPKYLLSLASLLIIFDAARAPDRTCEVDT